MAIEAVKTTGMVYQGSGQSQVVEATDTSIGASAGTEAGTLDNGNIKLQGTELNIDNGNDAAENKMPAPTEALKKAVEELNKKAVNSEAIFGIHEATNRVTIKIVDKDSREVLKEYPPEKTLDMIAKVWELAGILVDEKR